MRICLPLTAVAAALLVAAVPAVAQSSIQEPGKVIVRYVPNATHAARAAAQHGARAHTADDGLPGGARELTVAPGSTVAETIAKLRRDPAVAYAVPDYIAHQAQATTPPFFIPDDPGRGGAANWQT